MLKKFNSVQRGEYKAPRAEFCERCLEDLLCESPNGYTENIEDVEDFTW